MSEKPKTTPRVRGSLEETDDLARQHRRTMTPAEELLWNSLRARQLSNLKFRAQRPMAPFILDFWCAAQRLVVEVDGGIHDSQQEHDESRTRQLNDYGIQVIRFRNEEVLTNLESVLERIHRAATVQPDH